MQKISPEDPRAPYVKIAASLRAAILAGEFEPEAQLPTGTELAEFFEVTRATVGSAIRLLREEGFLRSTPGGGVYVTGQASLPASPDHPLNGLTAFLHEAGHLKNLPRAGWQLLGVNNPESVAEHSFRVGIVGMALAGLEGADIGRTAALCLLHDLHETRIGDVPSVGRAYVTTALPQVVTAHQTDALPHDLAEIFRSCTAEYEDTDSLESKVAHDADKIETLLQAREYEAQGYATKPWQDTSAQALRTESGKLLAQSITSSDPTDWWRNFAASYAELRATTRARQGLDT